MKDTEVHTGLPKKIERDFFQESLVNLHSRGITYDIEYNQNIQKTYELTNSEKDNFGSIRSRIKRNELELAYAKEWLNINQSLLGILLLMKSNGWEEFDMSEHIGLSGKHYRSFIGTQEEFDKFIEQFEK